MVGVLWCTAKWMCMKPGTRCVKNCIVAPDDNMHRECSMDLLFAKMNKKNNFWVAFDHVRFCIVMRT